MEARLPGRAVPLRPNFADLISVSVSDPLSLSLALPLVLSEPLELSLNDIERRLGVTGAENGDRSVIDVPGILIPKLGASTSVEELSHDAGEMGEVGAMEVGRGANRTPLALRAALIVVGEDEEDEARARDERIVSTFSAVWIELGSEFACVSFGLSGLSGDDGADRG